MAGIRNEETDFLEPSPSCLVYTCVSFEVLKVLKDSFGDCNRALVLGRAIPDHADFVRTTKVAYARCFGFTVRHVLFVTGKTGKPDALQNEGFFFFFLQGYIANVQLSTQTQTHAHLIPSDRAGTASPVN